MRNWANGRSAIMIMTAILALGAGPAKAGCDKPNCGWTFLLAQNADPAPQAEAAPKLTTSKRSAKQAETTSRRKAAKVGAKSRLAVKKPATGDSAAGQAGSADGGTAAVSASVANAQARMVGPEDAAKSLSDARGPAQDGVQGPAQAAMTTPDTGSFNDAAAEANGLIVASDQLNDLDRAASEEKPAPRIIRLVPQTALMSTTVTEDTWAKTSLIGKVFIALGGLLTMASAARMFVA
jgi:hypothetical protein